MLKNKILFYITFASRGLLARRAVVVALVAFAAAFAVALALHAYVIAQKCAEDEVFLGRQLVERLVDYQSYGVEAFASAEIQVEHVTVDWLHDVVDALTLKSAEGKVGIFSVEREQHHVAHTFLVFVYMVHENLHICGTNFGLCHCNLYLLCYGCKVNSLSLTRQYLNKMIFLSQFKPVGCAEPEHSVLDCRQSVAHDTFLYVCESDVVARVDYHVHVFERQTYRNGEVHLLE